MQATPALFEQRRAAAEEALEGDHRRLVDSGACGGWIRRMSLSRRYAHAYSLWVMLHGITGHSAGNIATWIRGDIDRSKQLHERVGQVTRQLVPSDRLDRVLDAARTRAPTQATMRTTAGRSR